MPVLHFQITPQDLSFILVHMAPLTASFPSLPLAHSLPVQVQLAETVLWEKSSTVAGLSAVSRLQLFPGGLCHPGGAVTDTGASDRH